MFTNEVSIARNDRFVQPFVLSRPGFDWSGCTWSIRLLNRAGGTVIETLTPTLDTSVLGEVRGSVTLSDEDRTSWPKQVLLEFTVSKPYVQFGPHTFGRITIKLI